MSNYQTVTLRVLAHLRPHTVARAQGKLTTKLPAGETWILHRIIKQHSTSVHSKNGEERMMRTDFTVDFHHLAKISSAQDTSRATDLIVCLQVHYTQLFNITKSSCCKSPLLSIYENFCHDTPTREKSRPYNYGQSQLVTLFTLRIIIMGGRMSQNASCACLTHFIIYVGVLYNKLTPIYYIGVLYNKQVSYIINRCPI